MFQLLASFGANMLLRRNVKFAKSDWSKSQICKCSKCPPLHRTEARIRSRPGWWRCRFLYTKALLYTSPHINQTVLQIVQILELCLVNSVLKNALDFVVDRIKVWAIRQPQIWRDKCRCVTFQEIDGVTFLQYCILNLCDFWNMTVSQGSAAMSL